MGLRMRLMEASRQSLALKTRKNRGFCRIGKRQDFFSREPLTGDDAAVELAPHKRRAYAGAFALFFDNLAVNS
jgi:hypothetical protein